MGNWPSNYKSPSGFSGFGGKVISNNWNEGGFGITDAVMISGHRTVKALEDLYVIPTQILSSNKSNKNTAVGWEKDAVGQLWYVQDANEGKGGYYRLLDLSKKSTAQGWEEVKIQSADELNSSINEPLKKLKTYVESSYSYLNEFNQNVLRFPLIQTNTYSTTIASFDYGIPYVHLSVDEKGPNSGLMATDSHKLKVQTTVYKLPGFKRNLEMNGSITYALTGNTNDPDTTTPDVGLAGDKAKYNYILNTGINLNSDGNYDFANLNTIVTDVNLDNEGNLNVTRAIPRNYLHGLLMFSSKDEKDENGVKYKALKLRYHKNGQEIIKSVPEASDVETGVLKNTDFANFNDIVKRLNAAPEKRTMPAPTGAATFKVYKNDGTTLLTTYTDVTTVNLEQGCKYEISNMHATWKINYGTGTMNSREITGTSGLWGNTAKDYMVPDPANTSYTYNFPAKTIAKAEVTGYKSWSQSLTGVIEYGIDGLQVVDGYVKKINGSSNKKSATTTMTFSMNMVYHTIRWWGSSTVDPRTWMPKNNVVQTIDVNVLNSIGMMKASSEAENGKIPGGGSDRLLTKGITIADIQTQTTSKYKYFVYVYRASAGVLTQASTPGSDATMWFNTQKPFKIKVASKTNGYVAEYYVVYGDNENLFQNKATLTFK